MSNTEKIMNILLPFIHGKDIDQYLINIKKALEELEKKKGN